ncbi:hypothetical protein FB561_3998 [Kribbella amoyensis]|uniref:Arsenate reductase n=1 Tax=Kribbella amoyensis TaxID=996641 RepID=A0A561BVS5_9ACTN|nr:hypothetical protein [Kribbella amoyensis]TWD82852.1 hypothetical protein FB561_3998 [Kribbella amoyensis]
MTENLDWIDSSCTLPTADRPLRVAEFDALFRTAVRAVDRPTSSLLVLHLDPAAESEARELTARENACCSFFDFTFTAGADDVLLRVEVPAGRTAVLDGLAGRAAGWST